MTIFQYVGITVAVALMLICVRNLFKGRGRFSIRLLWIAIWAGAAVAIFVPDLTTVIARAIGIQRGADLVFYCAVLLGLVGFFVVYLRMRRTDHEMTILVRELALERVWDAGMETPVAFQDRIVEDEEIS